MVVAVVAVTVLVLGLDRMGMAPLRGLATELYSWALILGAFALLLGALNVGWVHLRRIQNGQAGWGQSLALVVTMLVVFVSGLLSPAGARSPLVEWLFDSLLAPAQAMLFALLAFFMAGAAYRFLRVGRPGGAWMLAGVLLVLAVQMPLAHSLLPPTAGALVGWVVDIPGMAALRGVLLGSSFALLVAVFRYLLTMR
jgi:hypothetical protein